MPVSSADGEDAECPSVAQAVAGHIPAAACEWQGAGLRDFFHYKDLGIAKATDGKLLMQLVRAHNPPAHGTGWHRYDAEFHVIHMLRGWARFMVGDQPCLVQAGDSLNQAPEVARYLYDYSPDMEYLEIVAPMDFRTVAVNSTAEVPAPEPWYQDESHRFA